LRTAVTEALGPVFDAVVKPLVVDRKQLRPGGRVTLVAGRLRNRHRHKIGLLLVGPGYSGHRTLLADYGYAGATITLPKKMRPGRWIMATEDLSSVRDAGIGNEPRGRADDRVGVFAVPETSRAKHPGR
jgi:hypothetical protein